MYEGYAPHSDSTHVVGCFIRYVSPTYFKVFRLQPLSGSFEAERWDKNEYPMPVLMSETLSDSLFSGRNGVGETCFNPYFLNSVQPETNYKVMAVLPAHKTDEYERYEPFYLSSQFAADLLASHCVRVASNSIPGFTERFYAGYAREIIYRPLLLIRYKFVWRYEGSFRYRARNGELSEYYLCRYPFLCFQYIFRDAGYFLVSDS